MEPVTLLGIAVIAGIGVLLTKSHANAKKLKDIEQRVSGKKGIDHNVDHNKESQIEKIVEKVG